MKKLFLASIALLSVLVFSACSQDEIVTKKPEIQGEHSVRRVTNMVGLPANVTFQPLTESVTLKLDVVTDELIDITLPATTYNYNGVEMTMPEFTINNVPVMTTSNNELWIFEFKFDINEDGKKDDFIEGHVRTNGELKFTVIYKYGKMPFVIEQTLQTLDYNVIFGGTY